MKSSAIHDTAPPTGDTVLRSKAVAACRAAGHYTNLARVPLLLSSARLGATGKLRFPVVPRPSLPFQLCTFNRRACALAFALLALAPLKPPPPPPKPPARPSQTTFL